jgi:hypothetical protein
MLKYHYQVSKYNPWPPDDHEEWTGPHQIGAEFGGQVFTEDEFEATVNKYLYAVELFATKSGVDRLTVVGLDPEAPTDELWAPVHDGSTVSLDQALRLVRSMLRGTALGAPLEAGGRFYVHVGDYMYMWIGSHVDCSDVAADLERIGIYTVPGEVSPMLPDADKSSSG